MNREPSNFDRDDRELVALAQRGAADAFGTLVTRYQDRVYNICYRLCNERAEALDLTQATFLRALEALPRFEARAGFYTWLFRIAVNLALSERRARLRRRTVPLDAAADTASSSGRPDHGGSANPADRVEQCELRQRLEAALTALAVEFRVAGVLRDIEGLDYAQIAEIIGVPVGTVKSRIARGRMLLRAALVGERNAVDSRPG